MVSWNDRKIQFNEKILRHLWKTFSFYKFTAFNGYSDLVNQN